MKIFKVFQKNIFKLYKKVIIMYFYIIFNFIIIKVQLTLRTHCIQNIDFYDTFKDVLTSIINKIKNNAFYQYTKIFLELKFLDKKLKTVLKF